MEPLEVQSDFPSSQPTSELDENELEEMEKSEKPASAVRATDYGMKRFQNWLERRGKFVDYHTITAEEMNARLRKYYAELKALKQEGVLSPITLTCLRAAIHRYITSAPYNRPFNIIKDREFISANMFTARCKLYFKAGNGRHKPALGTGTGIC